MKRLMIVVLMTSAFQVWSQQVELVIFREKLFLDPLNKINLQYSHKIIKNYIDELNSSSELKSKTPQEDSQHSVKLTYVSNYLDAEKANNILSYNLSSSLVNTINSL